MSSEKEITDICGILKLTDGLTYATVIEYRSLCFCDKFLPISKGVKRKLLWFTYHRYKIS